MTRVSELEQAWRQIAGMIDREDVPWQRVAHLTEESLDLGENLLRTPAANLGDVAIKVGWLAEQDLDQFSPERAALRAQRPGAARRPLGGAGRGRAQRRDGKFVALGFAIGRAGAACKTRTCDPRITNAMLYQLS